jgi:Protein of unknown function (DUF2489)
MSAHVANEWARGEAVRTARAVLSGELGVLEGCIPLASIAHDVVADWRIDPDFVIFGAVASEADELPLGKAREQWSAAALARADLEIDRYTREVHGQVLAACRNVVNRFEPQQPAGAV